MKIINGNFKFKNPLTALNLNNVQYIILHHAEAKTAAPQEIHLWHLNNGWCGFGYNEYIRKDGTVVIGRGDNVGAQCQGYNSKSYGICAEGNYDIEHQMPKAQFDALAARIKYHKKRFINLKEIGPHKKYYPTACPGKYFPLKE